VNTTAQANLVASLYFVFSLLFGGLFFNAQTTGSDATYLTYLSFVHYAYESLCSNEFMGLQLIFNPKGYEYVLAFPSPYCFASCSSSRAHEP
jgi:hypothetical protein